jgi:hypothetical protein
MAGLPASESVEFDHNGVHVCVFQNGKMEFTATFTKGSVIERHDLRPELADIRVAVEHAKALLDR